MSTSNTFARMGMGLVLLAISLCGCSAAPAGAWTVAATANFGQPTLSVMFRDASSGIATDLGCGIYYSEDGGATWTYVATAGLSRVALEMEGGRTWHVGFGGWLSRSGDDGHTWDGVGSLPHTGHLEYLSFADENNGWAVSTERTEIFITRDGGLTWESLPFPDGMGRPAALHLRTPQDGSLLDTTGALFVSADCGATWTRLSLPFGDGWTIPTLNHTAAMRFTDAPRGFVALFLLGDGQGRVIDLRTPTCSTTGRSRSFVRENKQGSRPYLGRDRFILAQGLRTFLDLFQQDAAHQVADLADLRVGHLVDHLAPVAVGGDHPHALQDGQLPRDVALRQSRLVAELADRHRPVAQDVQHVQPGLVAHRLAEFRLDLEDG